MKRFMNKKVATIGLAAGLALGAAGAAFAYFTATGTNTGTGSVGTGSWTVNSPTPTGTIYAGEGNNTFGFTVTNSSPGSQDLQSVTASVAPDATAATAGCLASWYSVSIDGATATATTQTETYTAPGVVVAAGNDQPVSVVVTLPNLTATNQSACEGDNPVVTLTAN